MDIKHLTLQNEHLRAKLMKLESNINHGYYSFNREKRASKSWQNISNDFQKLCAKVGTYQAFSEQKPVSKSSPRNRLEPIQTLLMLVLVSITYYS